jgi:hypothetical protein
MYTSICERNLEILEKMHFNTLVHEVIPSKSKVGMFQITIIPTIGTFK